MMKFFGKKIVKIVFTIIFSIAFIGVVAYFLAAKFAPNELDNFKGFVSSHVSFLDQRAKISDDFLGKTGLNKIDKSGYNKLTADKKSAIIFVDSSACHTADRMREWLKEYSKDKKVQIQQMMWSEVQESYLHDKIKYYPSVAIMKEGEIIKTLDTNLDSDAIFYNDKARLIQWIENSTSITQ